MYVNEHIYCTLHDGQAAPAEQSSESNQVNWSEAIQLPNLVSNFLLINFE